ncbi:MAG: tetratricopeptide repeat protein [Gloeobacteraceae cyanobacterium ES-bin-144]|nr:tetratricopeptide repeat protein [Verrucomicrobiales bacterium]
MKSIIACIVVAAFVSQSSAETPAPTPAQQAEQFYRQGQAAEQAGDPVAAQKAYTEALKLNPGFANARYSLGQLKITSGAIATKGRELKFGAVIIPEFKLDGATLQEALDALCVIIEKQSKGEVAPNFIVQDPKAQLASAKISLNLKSMPSKAILQYLMDQSGANARFDEHAIVISPRS